MFAASPDRIDAVKLLLQRGADAKVTSKSIDLAQQSALDRAARQLQQKILDATVPKGQKATASQLQAAVQAARELLLSGKVPPPEARPAGPDTTDRNFNPEEINPPVQRQGRPDRAASRRAPGLSRDDTRASSRAAPTSISRPPATARRRS